MGLACSTLSRVLDGDEESTCIERCEAACNGASAAERESLQVGAPEPVLMARRPTDNLSTADSRFIAHLKQATKVGVYLCTARLRRVQVVPSGCVVGMVRLDRFSQQKASSNRSLCNSLVTIVMQAQAPSHCPLLLCVRRKPPLTRRTPCLTSARARRTHRRLRAPACRRGAAPAAACRVRRMRPLAQTQTCTRCVSPTLCAPAQWSASPVCVVC